jgi:multiple sugar transport system permease protein
LTGLIVNDEGKYALRARWTTVLQFLGPATVLLLVVVLFPLLYSFYLSFHSWNLFKASVPPQFVGFSNYLALAKNPIFLVALKNTLLFTVITVASQFALGFATALLLNRKWPYRSIRTLIRSALIIPMMFTYVVVGLLWAMIYHSELGVLNYLLAVFGVTPVNWLGDANVAMWSIILVDLWFRTPFVTLLMLAGLQNIPQEPVEAARIDGANRLQIFIHVVLPLLKPVILVVLVMRTMWNFMTFDTVFILTRGGPGYATELLTTFGYKTAFRYYRMGEASAISFCILFLIMIITILYIRFLGQEEK